VAKGEEPPKKKTLVEKAAEALNKDSTEEEVFEFLVKQARRKPFDATDRKRLVDALPGFTSLAKVDVTRINQAGDGSRGGAQAS
jgi:hypothetical protein